MEFQDIYLAVGLIIGTCILTYLLTYRSVGVKCLKVKSLDKQCETQFSETRRLDKQCQTVLRFLKSTGTNNDDAMIKNSILQREDVSTGSFEVTCEVCEHGSEKEAITYCNMCQQFMCLTCNHVHERLQFYKLHKCFGKSNFDNIRSHRGFSTRLLIPVAEKCIKYCKKDHSSYYTCSSSCNFKDAMLGVLPSKQTTGITFMSAMPNLKNDEAELCFGCSDGTSDWEETFVFENLGLFCPLSFQGCFCFPTEKDDLLLTVPSRHSIFKVDVSLKKITLFSKFFGECYCIAKLNGNLAVSVKIHDNIFESPSWQIQVLSMDGKTQSHFVYDTNGKPMFKSAKFIASNSDETVLYVSDIKQNRIIALNTEGQIVLTFSDSAMYYPKGLTVDDDGNIYVACGSKVLQFDKKGTFVREAVKLKSTTKVTGGSSISRVYFDGRTELLAVVEGDWKVTVFKFLPEI